VTNIIGGVAFPTEPTISTGTGRNKVSSAPRLVPDISLFASPDDPGMLVCSSDTSAWDTGQSGSCVNGFYDATNTYLTIFGGTSFDGPIFAGMLSIINQAVNSTGQGNVNSTLYSIAASSTATYNSAFHDITSGSNACYDFYETESGYPAPPAPMPAICGVGVATTEFSATTGYDLASGLGSVDLNNLITAWPRTAPGATLIGTITTLTPSTTTPALSTADTIAISVVSSTGNTVPTGTVSVSVDNVVANPSVPLISGAASYSFSSAVLGEHIVTVTYSDDTTHAKSVGVASLYVGTTTPSFTISASNATVAAGGSATTTVVITPVGGYTGSVSFTLTAPTTLANSCVAQSSASVTGGPVSTVFTIYTNSSNCPAGAVTLAKNSRESIGKGAQVEVASQGDVAKPSSQALNRRAAIAGSFAGLLLLFGVRRRSKLLRATASLALLVMLFAGALGLTGCVPAAHTGTVSTTAALNNASTGTYPITITANDSVNPTLTTSTTFTLTVQ